MLHFYQFHIFLCSSRSDTFHNSSTQRALLSVWLPSVLSLTSLRGQYNIAIFSTDWIWWWGPVMASSDKPRSPTRQSAHISINSRKRRSSSWPLNYLYLVFDGSSSIDFIQRVKKSSSNMFFNGFINICLEIILSHSYWSVFTILFTIT